VSADRQPLVAAEFDRMNKKDEAVVAMIAELQTSRIMAAHCSVMNNQDNCHDDSRSRAHGNLKSG
jgi:hypothetical protein